MVFCISSFLSFVVFAYRTSDALYIGITPFPITVSRPGIIRCMEMRITLPEEVLEALGEDPEREALEALLLHLIRREKISVGRAGEVLGLDKMAAIHWYTSHGHKYPNLTEEDLEDDFRFAERFTEGGRRR
jgi:predicted HTH domain antitoxin